MARRSKKIQTVNIPKEIEEANLLDVGYQAVAGIDEVGVSSWAGPLIAAAIILPANRKFLGLRDSKMCTRKEREVLSRRLKKAALAWSVGKVSVAELNQIGLARALDEVVCRAVTNLSLAPDFLLIDGNRKIQSLEINQKTIIKGDVKVRCIAAASVIAKVERDQIMRTLHRNNPALKPFRFDSNKGYPSPLHRKKINELGPTLHHRLCFKPVRASLTEPLFSS